MHEWTAKSNWEKSRSVTFDFYENYSLLLSPLTLFLIFRGTDRLFHKSSFFHIPDVCEPFTTNMYILLSVNTSLNSDSREWWATMHIMLTKTAAQADVYSIF